MSTPSRHKDILSWSPQYADYYLRECKKKACEIIGAPIPDDAMVFLVALDGGAAYLAEHRDWWKIYDFVNHCRRILADHEAVLLPPGADGQLGHVTAAWFSPESPASPVAAAVRIHAHFTELNFRDRADWIQQKHALVGVGRHEFAAFRLLQMSARGTTVIDPVIWNRLPVESRAILSATRAGPPDVTEREADIRELVRTNVEQMHQVVRVATAVTKGSALSKVKQ